MSNDWFYKFTIDKEIEVEKTTEDKDAYGSIIKTIKKVKEKQPVTFAFKKPNRKLYEKADLFYGVQLSNGIKAGLLTKALLMKRYRNDGGALSDADTNYFKQLSVDLHSVEEQHQRIIINIDKLSPEEKEKKLEEIVKKKTDILQALQDLENMNQSLFAHTAESKALVQLTNWWFVNLAYIEEGNDFKPYFNGNEYEEKMNDWDIKEQKEDIFAEVVSRFSLLIALWQAGAQSEKDFKEGEQNYASLSHS